MLEADIALFSISSSKQDHVGEMKNSCSIEDDLSSSPRYPLLRDGDERLQDLADIRIYDIWTIVTKTRRLSSIDQQAFVSDAQRAAMIGSDVLVALLLAGFESVAGEEDAWPLR